MAKDIAQPEESDSLETTFTDAASAASDPPSDPPVTTTETVEATVTETPAEPTPEPQMSQVAEEARALGIEFSETATDAEIARAAFEQLQAQQPYVSFAQQIAPHSDKVRQILTGQPQQPAEQTPPSQQETKGFDPASYFKEKYGGPEWSNEHRQAVASGLVQRDPETGLWAPAPGQEILAAGVVQELNAAQLHSRQVWEDISQGNPFEKFYDVLKDPFMHEVENRVNQILAEREQQTSQVSAIDAFEKQHASWLYASNPQTGELVPTEKGAAFIETLENLRSSGVTDTATALQFASQMHNITGQPAATPEAAPPQPETTTPPKETFLESAKRRAGHSPSATGAQAAAADAPQVDTEGDLNSMFKRAFAQQTAS